MLLATEYPNWKSSLRLGHHDLDVRLLLVRYPLRFFERFGHETTYASCGDHYFFNISYNKANKNWAHFFKNFIKVRMGEKFDPSFTNSLMLLNNVN